MAINEIQVSYSPSVAVGDRQKVKNSQDAFRILWDWWDKKRLRACPLTLVLSERKDAVSS